MTVQVPLIRLNEINDHLSDSPWHLITEPTVWNLHKDKLIEVLGPCEPIIVPSGDECKTLTHVEEVLGKLLNNGLNRQHRIIGFGGGAVCDFAAFVASVALRGVEHLLIPTTLLAQVDAAHGGKTAVNLKEGKNLCGAFKFAKAIVIEQSYLKTLDEAEWNNGRAEVYKTALIAGNELYERVLASDNYDTQLLLDIAEVKNQIVKEDPYEKGKRAWLNLGHTGGHAIEAQKQHNHGECVGMGMRYALRLGKRLGVMTDDTLIEKTDTWLEKNKLPTNPIHFNRNDFFKYLKTDKKQSNKGLQWVYVKCAGDIVMNTEATQEDYVAILDELNW